MTLWPNWEMRKCDICNGGSGAGVVCCLWLLTATIMAIFCCCGLCCCCACLDLLNVLYDRISATSCLPVVVIVSYSLRFFSAGWLTGLFAFVDVCRRHGLWQWMVVYWMGYCNYKYVSLVHTCQKCRGKKAKGEYRQPCVVITISVWKVRVRFFSYFSSALLFLFNE